MFNLRIFYCASLVIPNASQLKNFKFFMARKRSTFADSQHILHCHCTDPQIDGIIYSQRMNGTLPENFPLYSRCKFLAFKMPRFQQFVYELIPEDQKREFHLKAIDIYKVEARKCKACGDGTFLEIPIKHKVSSYQKFTPTFSIVLTK